MNQTKTIIKSMTKSIPIYISFCVSKSTEIELEDSEVSNSKARQKFMESDHYIHLKNILHSAGFYIDDFDVIIDD